MRRHEERHGALEDRAAIDAARSAAPEFEARVLHRALVLGAREGWRDAILRWHGRLRLALAAGMVLALVLGFGAAAGVLGDGSRAVNVVWALGGLLGVNLFSLLLWGLATLLPRSAAGARGGVAPGGLSLRLLAFFDRSPEAADLPLALGSLLGRGRAASWGAGAVGHALWALALLGAAAGVLALLATRRYGFVWETTILPAGVFVWLTEALGSLPGLLGFPVPDAATVAASGDAPMLEEGGRRAWAGWLIGALLVYGAVPRAALALMCAGLWARRLHGLRLDLGRPAYARLRPLLLPDSERIGVRDPEPAVMPRPERHAARVEGVGAPALVALELGGDLAWPPAVPRGGGEGRRGDAAFDGGRLDSREQRRAALARFAAQPPRRLLIAVDPRRTPDRGNLGVIADLADHAVEARVWALGADGKDGAGRLPLWRDGLARLGFAPDALILDAVAAGDWLAGRQPEHRP
ncbi:DUF2868 domain-containing protein [Thauera linaloolentis]|uniref:DUF2868 domain-containing protein n=1 Tax=Thauera linaloolentis (strain DSM 12138 / JCM 21573 / CCUG 41526 / CIP 105981 / IAM 15112 / NBRC 102519 / 47Lol) TaxID=1123367 RepID=N6Z5K1_THAL4|nr:DUF2868 domain-containing protein [Thauera linaloolentis]ENO87429.1 hypothetical protein C666_11065 [Thauera linaloolentis 47Lol = DSM 12138]MCM8565079.1 DUF2868 domain-containing protein [Thauera linaloolentis]